MCRMRFRKTTTGDGATTMSDERLTTIHQGHALDLLADWHTPLDLVVTDPPYAFGGNGSEHAVSAAVACTLRETAKHLRRGSWMVVLCASSWRSISYMVESVRGIVDPVRVGTWCKPTARTKVRTVGWGWTTVAAVAMRKGPKNRAELSPDDLPLLDWVLHEPVVVGRRAQLPERVAEWATSPFVVPGGVFLDPFSGSGALPAAAAKAGMVAHGFELSPDGNIGGGAAAKGGDDE